MCQQDFKACRNQIGVNPGTAVCKITHSFACMSINFVGTKRRPVKGVKRVKTNQIGVNHGTLCM